MADTKKVLDMIKEHDVKYVDFRFTDPRGKWQHLAHHVRTITPEFLTGGGAFDGSSIAGWKAINGSDMLLGPDCSTAVMDPFAAEPQLIVFCDVHDPLTGQPYARDPRSTAKKAEAYLASTGIGDTPYFGPEAPRRRPIRHPRRDALGHVRHGIKGREAPPRGGALPGRARRRVRHAGA